MALGEVRLHWTMNRRVQSNPVDRVCDKQAYNLKIHTKFDSIAKYITSTVK